LADKVYEGMFILDANRYGRDPEGLSKQISTLIQGAGGEILVSRFWEERRLAYPIEGHRKGVYWLTYFKLSSVRLLEIQRKCEISEEILRSLFLGVDPRIVETLVAHAKAGTIASYSVPEKEEPLPAARRIPPTEALAAAEAWDAAKGEAGPA
jgi:small subunit ribosomal protein S6